MTALASERRIPEQSIDDIDHQFDHGTNEDEVVSVRELEPELVGNALNRVLGYNKHRKKDIPLEARAQIVGSGIAGISDDFDGHLASSVNRMNGTMIIAEGTGSQVGVEATIRGFERSMQRRKTAKATLNSAATQVRETFDVIIPHVIQETKLLLGRHAHDTTATALAIQIVDDTLVYKSNWHSDRPLYVFNETTGECKRLTYPGIGEGIYTLEPGRNIIVMSNGRATDEDLPMTPMIAGMLQETTKDPEYRSQDNEATRIAERLSSAFSTEKAAGAVMVSIVEVAPWVDKRPELIQKLDWAIRAPSSFAYLAISNTMNRAQAKRDEILGHTPHKTSRREVYETNTNAGRMGRIAARVGDVVTDAAFLWAAFSLTRTVLAAAGVDMFGHHPSGGTAAVHHPVHESPVPPGGGSVSPHGVEPAPKPTFPDLYTALSDDPANGNSASNVTDISRQALTFYGHQAGLSTAQIHDLTHNNRIISQLNEAFMHDKHDPHNRLVLYDKRNFLNQGDRYSTKDVQTLAEKIVHQHAHSTAANTPSSTTSILPSQDTGSSLVVMGDPVPIPAEDLAANIIPPDKSADGWLVALASGLTAVVGMATLGEYKRRRQLALANNDLQELAAYERTLLAINKKPRNSATVPEPKLKRSVRQQFRDWRENVARQKEADRDPW